jgi:hypothetical protein
VSAFGAALRWSASPWAAPATYIGDAAFGGCTSLAVVPDISVAPQTGSKAPLSPDVVLAVAAGHLLMQR